MFAHLWKQGARVGEQAQVGVGVAQAQVVAETAQAMATAQALHRTGVDAEGERCDALKHGLCQLDGGEARPRKDRKCWLERCFRTPVGIAQRGVGDALKACTHRKRKAEVSDHDIGAEAAQQCAVGRDIGFKSVEVVQRPARIQTAGELGGGLGVQVDDGEGLVPGHPRIGRWARERDPDAVAVELARDEQGAANVRQRRAFREQQDGLQRMVGHGRIRLRE